MNHLMRRAMAGVLGLMVLGGGAHAGIVITIEQVGPDVVAAGSGSLDLAGLTPVGSGTQPAGIEPDIAIIVMGPVTATTFDGYTGITGPSSFGTGLGTVPDSGSNPVFGINAFFGLLLVPSDYGPSSQLSSTNVYTGHSIASLGLTPGSYAYTWGAGNPNQSVVINVIAVPVPEPSTLILLGLGAVTGLVYLRKSRAV